MCNNLTVSSCSNDRESQRLDFPLMLRRPLPCEYSRDFPGISRTKQSLGHPDDRDGNADAGAGSPIGRLDGVGAAAYFVEGWVLVTARASPTQEHHFKHWVATQRMATIYGRTSTASHRCAAGVVWGSDHSGRDRRMVGYDTIYSWCRGFVSLKI